MNCIIVDDDNNCIKALGGILTDYVPTVKIAGTANTIAEAVKLVHAGNLDVVFLDVEIQDEVGFDLFKFIPAPKFEVVFTTAHEKYMMKAIKSSCFDYLLKPIDIQELVNTIARMEAKKNQALFTAQRAEALMNNVAGTNKKVAKLAVPVRDGMQLINVPAIVYLEGDAKYTTLYLDNGERYVSSKNIGEFEEMLDAELFFRCHRSWIVNLKHVAKYLKQDNQVMLTNNKLIDVSVRKKDEFLKLFYKV
ncbi:MAG TPA: LytTR family DNA-binding domain-containing protein [Flavobacteriales bacterium]|nr:LytTR family DNA-binding domain-containing protein [Flavobacteriales bacterium]